MVTGYKAGDKVYIIESNRIVRECTIVRDHGDLYIIKFDNGGGIQIKVHKLFRSKEEAEENLPKPKSRSKQKNTSPRMMIGTKSSPTGR